MSLNPLGSLMTEASPIQINNQTEETEQSTVLIDVTSKNTDSFTFLIIVAYTGIRNHLMPKCNLAVSFVKKRSAHFLVERCKIYEGI